MNKQQENSNRMQEQKRQSYEPQEELLSEPSSKDELFLAFPPTDLIDLINEDSKSSNTALKNFDSFLKDRIIEIENPQLIKESLVTSYKLYKIKSKKQGSERWETNVSRRFSDFEYLNHSLLQNFGGYVLPRLPDKNFLASFNLQTKQFQDVRVGNLTKYVERLLLHPQIRLSHELNWFLFDEEYSFSSQKGQFIEKSGAFNGIKNITTNMMSIGKSLWSRYQGEQKQIKNSFCKDGKEEVQLRVFTQEIQELLMTTKEMRQIVNCSHQEIVIMNQFVLEGDQVANEQRQKALDFLIFEFEDIAQFIENCYEAIQRTKGLRQELDALEEEEAGISAKQSENPRNRELDKIRNKLQKQGTKYDRWIRALKKQLALYSNEGKTLMQAFVKKFIEEKNKIYRSFIKKSK